MNVTLVLSIDSTPVYSPISARLSRQSHLGQQYSLPSLGIRTAIAIAVTVAVA